MSLRDLGINVGSALHNFPKFPINCAPDNKSILGANFSLTIRLYPFLHIPIDSVILGKIIGDFEIESVAVKGERVLLKNLSWSRIDKDTYDAIQNVLREKIRENEIPIVWEFKAWNNPKESE